MSNADFAAAKPQSYAEFLAAKQSRAEKPGRIVSASDVHPLLHPWQADLVAWAVQTSRAAIWADTGLGKTLMQLEWARLSGRSTLVIAPLAVCQQTIREATKIGIRAHYVRELDTIDEPGMWVTNYENVPKCNPSNFDSVVLDESSILKQSDGKTRSMLIDWARDIPHRLACSATPAPNDPEELTNQAEWLGRMSRTHMLAAYFIHDQDGWRLKRHGREPLYEWMSGRRWLGMADIREIPTTRTCYLCRHTASWALFVKTTAGWRCKSGGACQRRIRTQQHG